MHVLPAAESEQAHIKYKQVRNTYIALRSSDTLTLNQFSNQLSAVKQTLYNQQHKISAACAMLVSNVPAVPTHTLVSIGENALSEFLNTLIDWERVCTDHLKYNVPMDQLSRAEQEEFVNATHCHICCKPFEGDQNPRGRKVRDHDHMSGWFIAAGHQQCNLQRSVNYKILCSSTTSVDTTPT